MNIPLPKTNTGTSWVGVIFVVAVAIASNPSLVSFLPESVANYLVGIAGILAAISGYGFVASVKNKNVTGGTVPATDEAKKRLENE